MMGGHIWINATYKLSLASKSWLTFEYGSLWWTWIIMILNSNILYLAHFVLSNFRRSVQFSHYGSCTNTTDLSKEQCYKDLDCNQVIYEAIGNVIVTIQEFIPKSFLMSENMQYYLT